MDLRRLFEILLRPKPKWYEIPAFFQPEEAWKACILSQFRHNDAVQLRFLERSSTRNFDRTSPHPSNLFAPSWNLSIPPLFFFSFRFQRLFRRMDSRFEIRRRAAFLTGSISRESPQFLWRRRMRTISFLPSRMDGRNFGETTMMKVSNVFQPWALPVGGVILSFASRFFLFARKWTKIRRYQVSFIIGNYISLDIRVEILIQQGKETNEKYLPCLSKLIIT